MFDSRTDLISSCDSSPSSYSCSKDTCQSIFFTVHDTDLSELRVDRKPISPDLPSYNPEFINRVYNPKPPFITHEEFTAALNDRLAAENSSYAEKEIEEIRLQKQISSELETIEKEKNKIVDFIEYLSIKSKEKED